MAAAVACDTAFVEPTPPTLVGGKRVFAPVPIVEPVVHALVVDFEIPDPAHCAATVARAEAVLRSIAASGRSAALPTVHLAPGCRQLPFRFFDASLIEQPSREAEASFPGSAIRPVVLYVNNVDLPLPFGVTEGLRALRFSATAQGRLAPRVYGLALEKARASGGFDAVGSWTHAGDEAMWTAVEELIGREVPFESTREVTVRAPLLIRRSRRKRST